MEQPIDGNLNAVGTCTPPPGVSDAVSRYHLHHCCRVIDEIKGTIYDLLDNGGDVSEITERRSVSYARWNLQAASLLLQAVYGGANYR